MRTLIPLAVLLSMVGAAPYALASEIKDQGPELAQDPYHHNTDLTTGRIAGFRSLYGDPDALADQLAPSTSGAKGEKADLPVLNTRSAWSDVRINGVKVGVIGPYDNGTVAGVQAGTGDRGGGRRSAHPHGGGAGRGGPCGRGGAGRGGPCGRGGAGRGGPCGRGGAGRGGPCGRGGARRNR
ncbi:MAG: hypothetical protein JRI25_13015 [Deltaproteobacteria bacterium]|nr:hypothetical protein [Deltaproteobacteria bacterium]